MSIFIKDRKILWGKSGAIELIGLLYRTAYYSEAADKEASPADAGKAFLDLAKNRNGATGRIPLTFAPEIMRFPGW